MPALTVLRQSPRTLLLTAAAVPLALALADDVRVRRQLQAAGRDELTQLPRRKGLNAYGKKAIARHRADGHLVLVLDGDGFKAVNDTYGHAAGDQVVVTLAARLREWTTAHRGLAARLGGDEFGAVVALPRHQAHQELAHLRAHMNRPVPYEGLHLPFSVSVGAAHSTDLPGRPWTTVLRAADVAMYRVKNREVPFPYLGTAADSAVEPVNGRRPGRPGTHLLPPAGTPALAPAALTA
jgi:diguanylate cyclase (GGDEF)-like protein